MYRNVPQCTTMYQLMYHNVPQCTTMYHNEPQCTTMYHSIDATMYGSMCRVCNVDLSLHRVTWGGLWVGGAMTRGPKPLRTLSYFDKY